MTSRAVTVERMAVKSRGTTFLLVIDPQKVCGSFESLAKFVVGKLLSTFYVGGTGPGN